MSVIKPFYNIKDLPKTYQEYLLNQYHQGDWNFSTTLSCEDQNNRWKPLDTMLNLFSLGLITNPDLMVWQSMIVEVREARRHRTTDDSSRDLAADINGISKHMSYLLRHGGNREQVIADQIRPGEAYP